MNLVGMLEMCITILGDQQQQQKHFVLKYEHKKIIGKVF